MTSPSLTNDKYFHEESPNYLYLFHWFRLMVRLSIFQICRTSVSFDRSSVFSDGMQIVWVIRLHEYRCLQCKRHAHSPNHRMFVAVFRCIFLRIAFASFALDHSPCARMIWILTTFLILLPCQNPSYPTMNLSVCCANTTSRPVLSSIISPDFHSWEDQVLSTFHSE